MEGPGGLAVHETNNRLYEEYHGFTASALLAAMAPQDVVLRTFLEENNSATCQLPSPQHHNDDRDDALAALIATHIDCDRPVCRRYVAHLLKLYLGEQRSVDDVTSEALLDMYLSTASTLSSMPDPNESGYCAFAIPKATNDDGEDDDTNNKENARRWLRIRVFPYHSDVSLKLWEAGAVLAEYLLHHYYLGNRRIVELGAGVGATGLALVMAGAASHVLCTDYTPRALDNLRHNFEIHRHAAGDESIQAARLDWNQEDWNTVDPLVQREFERAQVLLAADVAYDRTVLDPLVRTVQRFLQSNGDDSSETTHKSAIFATTRRNMETFRLLRNLVTERGMQCRILDYDPDHVPVVLPKKFHQPRSDVELWELTLL